MRPWWADGVLEFVRKKLNQKSLIFEWGSGNSTICLSKICKVISIENDKSWYDKMKVYKNNIDLHYVPDKGQSIGDPSNVSDYTSKSALFKQKDFSNYVKIINNYARFDLIVIDGRARTSCIPRAINHLKMDGVLLLDDYWREHYQPGIKLIPKDWIRKDFKSVEHYTATWTRTS